MFQKINFCSILASLVLFCFPWVDIQCSGKSQATQSGLQVVYGGASPILESETTKTKAPEKPDKEDKETLGFAPLTALALVFLLAAGCFSWRGLARGKRDPDFVSAALPALALVLLLLQWKSGFPAETRVPELLSASKTAHAPAEPAKTGLLHAILNPVSTVSTMVADNIEVKTLPAFFYLLGTLAIPPFALLTSLLPKAKSRKSRARN